MAKELAAHGSSDDLTFISASAGWRRALLVVLLVPVVTASWTAGRWFVGNAVASNAIDRAGAESAVRWSAGDPQAQYMMAQMAERRAEGFDPIANVRAALGFYERAAQLAPNDFRFWIELGRARERAGDITGATDALRRAAELAPAYASPRWLLGNNLLRAGQVDAAFVELGKAGEADAEYRQQVLALAWRYYEGNTAAVARAMGDTAQARAALVNYLIDRKRLDDARELLSSMTPAESETKRNAVVRLERALFDQKRFRDALAMNHAAESNLDGNDAPVEFERIANPGFEAGVPPPGARLFGWQIGQPLQTRVELDANRRHSGARSLRFIFESSNALDLRGIRQFVVVEPNRRYRLRFFVRAEELRSASLPLVEVASAANEGVVLGASKPGEMAANDWREEVIEFIVPDKTDGVIVRLARTPCADVVCPIFGRIWYDDFALERIGASVGR